MSAKNQICMTIFRIQITNLKYNAMFLKIWVHFYLNNIPGSVNSKSSIFLDIMWIIFFVILYTIIGSIYNADIQNSYIGILYALFISRFLSPIPLLLFSKQLFTTKIRLIAAAYIGLLPSFVYFTVIKLAPNVAEFDPLESIIKWNEKKPDKALHFLYSYLTMQVLFLIAYLLTKNEILSFNIAAAISLSVGFYKEIRDHIKNNNFAWSDIIYDGLGIISSIIFLKVIIMLFMYS